VAGGLTAAFLLGDGASGASAASASAPGSDWDRLAACESGGNWSINTGNGYYGGLQFNLATWRSVGGSGLPSQASRSEQIRRGNLLHDSRGWQPWPSCSRKLGLGRGSASRDEAPEPEAGDDSGEQGTQVEVRTVRRTERASRARRESVRAAGLRAVAPIAGKYQASRRARVVVALATVQPPTFDGHTMSVADAGTYRIAVKHWQRRMAARGWDLAVDGHFGWESASVAQRFAAQKGLDPAQTGTVDADVWNAAWALPVS
jgi:hypothetical protein